MKSILTILFFLPLSTSAQIITTVAGGGSGGGVDGYGSGLPATNATLGSFAGIEFDASGNLYIADKDRHIIRKVNAITNIITTIAGIGTAGYSGDGGQATNAKISSPGWIAFDSHGNLYFSDRSNHRVRKVSTSGIISTVAGNGVPGYSGDGISATLSSLSGIQGICVDKFDNIYISDYGNYRIRKVSTSGIISTVAGTGTMGYSGDGDAATLAQLKNIYGIRSDASANVYVADWTDKRIRKINTSTGIISTVAGNGIFTYLGDYVSATSTGIDPFDVAIDDTGNMIIADYTNNRIRKVDNSGVITTIAGDGITDFSGDEGPATSASLNRPAGVAFDPCGNLYIADNQNHRVRKLNYYSPCMPSYIRALNNNNVVLVYPNPTSSSLTIAAHQDISTINITNAISQVVYYNKFTKKEKVEIDVAHLPPGVYMVRVNGVYVRRFLKE